jgi:hypothetical protein
MKAEPYKGKVSGMKTANTYLASEDFMGLGEVELEISGVFHESEVVMQDGKKKDFFSIAFAKTSKRMVLNATNRRALAAAFGADTKAWTGQKVKLFAQDGVRNPAGGASVWGLRIKAKPDPELAKARRAEMTGGGQ